MSDPGSDDRQLAKWLERHTPTPARDSDWSDVNRRVAPGRPARRGLFGAVAVVAAAAVAIVVLIVAGELRHNSSVPPASGKLHAGSIADGTYLATFDSITRDGAGWTAAIRPVWSLQDWSDVMTSQPRADDSQDVASAAFSDAGDIAIVGTSITRKELCGTQPGCAHAEVRVTTMVQVSVLPVAPTVQVSQCGGGDACSRIMHPTISALATSKTFTVPTWWVTVQAGAVVKLADFGSGFHELPDVKAVVAKIDATNTP